MKKILSLIYIFALFGSLSAQDSTRIIPIIHARIDLGEVIVSANSFVWRDAPITSLNISNNELDVKNIGQEPSLIFNETPSITAYSDAGSGQGYSYFRMRGIDQTRVNITLDGMPLNEPEDQGSYFSNYPDLLNSVLGLQIQRGVGSSKNGSAGYAGSIQLLSSNLYQPQKANFGMGFGWFNSYRAFGEYNTGVHKGKGLYARASYLKSDGYKYHSGNSSQSAFISGGLYKEHLTWKLTAFLGHQQNELAWLGVADSVIARDRRSNANSAENDEFLQTYVQAQNVWRINYHNVLRSSVYYSHLNGGYDFDLNNFLGMPSTFEMYRYDFKSHFVGAFANYTYYTFRGLNWTTGIHANLYSRRHTGSERALGQLYQNTGFKNEFSAFSKLDFRKKKWLLMLDLQYRAVSFDYHGSVSFDKMGWMFLNPKAGVSYLLSDEANIYYSAGMSSREPTRNDMFGGSDDLLSDSTGQALLAISDAETVYDQELGFRINTNRLHLDVNLYYMAFQKEIVLNGKFGPNGLALTNNVDRSIRTGLELSASWDLTENLKLANNSSFNYSQIKEQTEIFYPILSPMFIVNQEVEYHTDAWSAALSGRYQSGSYMDFANSASLKSYFLLNARLAYRVRQFTFSLFANNLLGTKYYNNGYVDNDGSRKFFVQAPFNLYGNVSFGF